MSLAESHGLGLVHRALRPASVFLAVLGGETDVVKVLNFGLAKLTEELDVAALTAAVTDCDNSPFMAPEQATAGYSLDARADIYALGAMMYHALTGRPPFQGKNAFVVMMAHAEDAVVPPSQVRPGVPHDLEVVVLRCLAKKPGDRYPNVRELAETLGACASASEWGPRQADQWWASRVSTALIAAPHHSSEVLP
jgi:serine/threonine-protein kinase